MGFFSSDDTAAQYQDQYDQFQQTPHKAEVSHELIAGAAAFEAAKAFEKHQAANGKPQSHAEAKEILAAVIGGFVDREVETKGLDYIDKEKAKRQAQRQVEDELANQY